MPKIKDLIKMNHVDVLLVLDESSSMMGVRENMIKSVNDFIKEQKTIGDDAYFTFVKFNEEVCFVNERIPISDVKNITKEDYCPNGYTALYDAIYMGIQEIKKNNRNDKVVVVIVTDGEENASKSINNAGIKSLITECESKGWKFIFLASGIDATAASYSIGIVHGNTRSYSSLGLMGDAGPMGEAGVVLTCYRASARSN